MDATRPRLERATSNARRTAAASCARTERAEHGDGPTRRVHHTIDSRLQIELGLDLCERRFVLRRDENRLRSERRLARLGRQRTAGLREGLASERWMDLVDPKAVQSRDALERAARLCHDLWPDSVPGEARDGVPGATRHAATRARRDAAPACLSTASKCSILRSFTSLLLLLGTPEGAPILSPSASAPVRRVGRVSP